MKSSLACSLHCVAFSVLPTRKSACLSPGCRPAQGFEPSANFRQRRGSRSPVVNLLTAKRWRISQTKQDLSTKKDAEENNGRLERQLAVGATEGQNYATTATWADLRVEAVGLTQQRTNARSDAICSRCSCSRSWAAFWRCAHNIPRTDRRDLMSKARTDAFGIPLPNRVQLIPWL